MAKKPRNTAETSSRSRAYWAEEISKAKKRYAPFWREGENTVDEYRLQKANSTEIAGQDKFNILYSSTETIRPNLYAQRPKVRVKLRNKDTTKKSVRMAAKMLGGALEYVIEEEDFDEIMENAVEDYMLPGMGNAWVRYVPKFGDPLTAQGEDGQISPVVGEDGQPVLELIDETVSIDYVYWQDMLFGVTRGWKTLPWGARRLWLTKKDATERFGAEKAAQLDYCTRTEKQDGDEQPDETAEAWEIWDKRNRTAYWFAESYPDDLLDEKPDPLKLKNFFPFPRPMRAVSNTRTFVPRPLYSQYRSQSRTLNVLTRRIRMLADAIRVSGVYDGSMENLADLLNPAHGNRMVKVDQWAMFAQNGGIRGSVEWLPIEQIVAALIQLQQSREICKNEIYEITGFSDIVRGVSKASETLGAQNLKANWAGARVRKMQKEVQRFARDIIAIAGEIIAEHCEPASIALFASIDIPPSDQIQADPAAQQYFSEFKEAAAIIRSEIRRTAVIDIETDSTIMADEEAERKDRTDFLGAAGAFLQQAVPAMEATPELGPLLGAMLMFVVRTFPASQPIEDEFEKVQQVLAQGGQNQQNKDPNGHAAKAQAVMQVAQVRAQTEQARITSDQNIAQGDAQAKAAIEAEKARLAGIAEQNRHDERMAEIALKRDELILREREVRAKEAQVRVSEDRQELDEVIASHDMNIDVESMEHQQKMDVAGHNLEYDRMDAEAEKPETEGLTGEED